jgi:hypothetical protein
MYARIPPIPFTLNNRFQLSVFGPERNPSPHTTFPWFIGHNEYFGMNPIIKSAVLLWGSDL